jgi:hypothetical protein
LRAPSAAGRWVPVTPIPNRPGQKPVRTRLSSAAGGAPEPSTGPGGSNSFGYRSKPSPEQATRGPS